MRLALAGAARTTMWARPSLVAPELAQVEGVKRLPGEVHHVVGHVDDVVDGAASRHAVTRRASQSGDGPILTPLTTRAT